MLNYILVLTAKIVENCLATLRLILVANGRKIIGAILQGFITLIWLYSTSVVINNKSLLSIIFFCIGAFIGSYLGSYIEEKVAFGNNLLFVIMNINKGEILLSLLNNIDVNVINRDDKYMFLTINIQRKKRHKLSSFIKNIDNTSKIYVQKTIIN